MCGRCGNLRSECSDPNVDWHPRTSVCFASATSAWGWRKLHEKHKSAKVGIESLHPTDGVSVWVSPVPPLVDEFA